MTGFYVHFQDFEGLTFLDKVSKVKQIPSSYFGGILMAKARGNFIFQLIPFQRSSFSTLCYSNNRNVFPSDSVLESIGFS